MEDIVVYQIRNYITKKIYIGKCTIPYGESLYSFRLDRLRRDYGCKDLWNAVLEYGTRSFVIGEICKASSHEEAFKLEKRYIQEFKSFDPEIGYNIYGGGDKCRPFVRSGPSSKRKMSYQDILALLESDNLSFTEIGRLAGVTNERIRQIAKKFGMNPRERVLRRSKKFA